MRIDDRCTDSSGFRPSTLQLDPDKDRSELDAFDLTAEQQHELLKTLWSIMQSFVDGAFTGERK